MKSIMLFCALILVLFPLCCTGLCAQDRSSIIERVEKSTVRIEVLTSDGKSGVGTGFAVRYSKGIGIVTSYHVVAGASPITVRDRNKNKFETALLLMNEEADLALLQCPSDILIEPVSFGDSRGLKKGNDVIAIGNPLGIEFSACRGMVSQPNYSHNDVHIIMMDIRLNPGNSGGPLFLEDGKVVGIVAAKAGGFANIDSVGIAVASEEIQKWLGAESSPVIGPAFGSPSKKPTPASSSPLEASAIQPPLTQDTESTQWIFIFLIIALCGVAAMLFVVVISRRRRKALGWLVVKEPDHEEKRQKIFEGTYTVGRASENSISIKDFEVSGSHVQFECRKEGIKLKDLGSRNGTKVNGKEVNEAFLGRGDFIEIGRSVISIIYI